MFSFLYLTTITNEKKKKLSGVFLNQIWKHTSINSNLESKKLMRTIMQHNIA